MFHIKDLKSFVGGLLDKPQTDVLPRWADANKNQSLKEVVVVTSDKISGNVKFYQQRRHSFEIRVFSSSSNSKK